MIGTFWEPTTAQGIDGSGILLSLLVLGFDYLLFCIACIGVADVLIRRQASYSLVWWSVVFPMVTMTTAWLELSFAMDSPPFRALTSAATVLIAIAYLANLAFTLRGIINGSLIFGPSKLEHEEELLKKAKKHDGGKEGA
jgi:tellurite resistance protein TehA-like permease